MLDRLSRYAPFTGVVFVVLVLIGIFTGNSSPNADASGERVISFYVAHKSSQQASDLLLGFAFMFFLFFIASLYTLLRNSPAVHTMALLGLGGALMFALGFAVFGGVDFALADVPKKLTPDAAQALNVLDNELFLPLFIGAVVFGVATGLAIVRSGLLPAWLGWAVLVFGIAVGTPAFFIGLIGLLIWTLVVSVLIYRRSGLTPAGRAPAPATV
jgi:hypothetical protein